MATLKTKLVEVSHDTLGFFLAYARKHYHHREGEPVCDDVGDVIYYRSRAAAKKAADAFNAREC